MSFFDRILGSYPASLEALDSDVLHGRLSQSVPPRGYVMSYRSAPVEADGTAPTIVGGLCDPQALPLR